MLAVYPESPGVLHQELEERPQISCHLSFAGVVSFNALPGSFLMATFRRVLASLRARKNLKLQHDKGPTH